MRLHGSVPRYHCAAASRIPPEPDAREGSLMAEVVISGYIIGMFTIIAVLIVFGGHD
jgi:hypothetical protein